MSVAGEVWRAAVYGAWLGGYRWRLLDGRGRELAASPVYPSVLAAEEAARQVLGSWLGVEVSVDLETFDGRTERLR